MLADEFHRARRGRFWTSPLLLSCCLPLWLVTLGRWLPAAEGEVAAQTAAAAAPQRMLIRTVNKATGQPISGVAINSRYFVVNGKTVTGLKISDKKGEVLLELPTDVVVRGVRLDAKAQGMVPYHFDRSSRNQALELPEKYTMPFEKAVAIGGVVRDADGNPVKNAEVKITYPATDADMQSYYYYLARNLRTDAAGRWTCNTVPEDFSAVNLRMEHPDYMSTFVQVAADAVALRDRSHELTMAHGPELSGLVVDHDGKPVKGAHVLVGTSTYDSNKREATTDEQGNFAVKDCNTGQQFLCVTAEGHAPEMQAFAVVEENPIVEVHLGPPATFRLRIVDQDGNPVAGAEPVPEHWRGQQMLRLRKKVDAEGRWEWKSAPHDEVRFSILAGDKNMTMRDVPLVAKEEEQVVRVHPKFRLVGNVTDAASGKPVKEFQVFSAFQVTPQKQWDKFYSARFKNGEYEYNFDELKPGFALRVEAEGYQPAESPTFTVEDYPEGIDFQLHKEVEAK